MVALSPSLYSHVIFGLQYIVRELLLLQTLCAILGNSVFLVCLYAVLYIISYFPVEFLSM